jgi:hypothetical protein
MIREHDWQRHVGEELNILRRSLTFVQYWVEDAEYKGYEPFDGLSSPLRRFVHGNNLGERILQQIVRQSPVNLRPLFGIKPLDSTKGRGVMAWGYLLLFERTKRPEYRSRAIACLDWLEHHKSPKFANYSWANHFDFASRGGTYYKDDSIVVWTSMIAQAYFTAFEQLGDERFLHIGKSACDWIMALPRERTCMGACISYHAEEQKSIHNANLLGAAALASASKYFLNEGYLEVARSAVLYSCARMRNDGSWWYAEEPKYHWIDSFHTAYNLDSLKCYIDVTGDKEPEGYLGRGFEYFKRRFVEPSGRPKYYHDRTYPVDIQCASQAIDTLANFAGRDAESLRLGLNVARWTIRNMQDERGFFVYRKYPFGVTARTPMLHWGQATMFKALAHLIGRVEECS